MRGPQLKRVKSIAILIGAQSVCLAVGLIVEHEYITAATVDQLEIDARSRLITEWEALLIDLSNADWKTGFSPEIFSSTSIGERVKRQSYGKLVVLDRAGNVIADPDQPTQTPSQDRRALFVRDAHLGTKSAHGPLDQGTLRRENANLPAIAVPRADREGSVLVYVPDDQFGSQAEAVLGSLTEICTLTWVWTTAILSVASYLIVSKIQDGAAKDLNKAVSDGLRQRQNLLRTRDAVIFGLAKLAESRDPDTGDHLDRISVYSTTLAEAISRHPDYRDLVTPAFVRNIGISSVLHDIGKVGIEDRVLLKPGRFTSGERSEMENHCKIAADCLREIEQRLGRTNFLEMAREIALGHHERWDGSGYPEGLRGEEIPLSARLVAIADVYDALSSRRVYKEARSHEDCLNTIRAGAGSHFDPKLVDIWLSIADRYADIARRYADEPVTSHGESTQSVQPSEKDTEKPSDLVIGA